MGATYTRQSSYTDGDVVQAADSNDEFDQLVLHLLHLQDTHTIILQEKVAQ